jgi:hypothetical protein
MTPNDGAGGLLQRTVDDSDYSDKCLQGTFESGLPLAEVTLENEGQDHTAQCASRCSEFGYSDKIDYLTIYAGGGVHTCPCVDVFADNTTAPS